MQLRRRVTVLLVLGAVGSGIYLVARRYSTDLVAHVVEQTLLQKAPPGMDSAELVRRFERSLALARGREERLRRLMDMAAQLEKVQRLDLADITRLLKEEPP